MAQRILVVDDDKDITRLIKSGLQEEGFQATVVYSGEDALMEIQRNSPDLVVLDRVLPGIDGLEVCQKIRSGSRTGHLPIIMLTSLDKEVDKLVGLGTGADDYLTKPFSVRELVARIKAVLRRYQLPVKNDVLQERDLRLFPMRHQAFLGEKELHLTNTEFRLLQFLMENKNAVLSRMALLDEIWDEDYSVTSRAMDVCIARLRENQLLHETAMIKILFVKNHLLVTNLPDTFLLTLSPSVV